MWKSKHATPEIAGMQHPSSLGVMTACFGILALGFMASFAEAGETLRDWGKQFPEAAARFVVLPDFNNEAVLDKETQVVWELEPSDVPDIWLGARASCANKLVGGRKGWKLPSFDQLASLVDPSEANPALPANHPFIGVQSAVYWSAQAASDNISDAWGVDFSNGLVDHFAKGSGRHVWCMRSGQFGPAAY